jgi:hypothetical protein
MATYNITPHDAEFAVEVHGNLGTRQILFGFQTEADAEAWIQQDSQRADDKGDDNRSPSPERPSNA